jgi:hypothetical protein
MTHKVTCMTDIASSQCQGTNINSSHSILAKSIANTNSNSLHIPSQTGIAMGFDGSLYNNNNFST